MTRNIGISAHIDSGKTTLTERILFYTGRINAIHEVRGKDGVGAKMDSMELEREKGITIQSAATYCQWGDNHINIIDTPGHVDFTVEVERALRVLDGAVLVLCAVSGVQSQSITVDRQMRRYNVPRLAFINKLDRAGANPHRVMGQLREKLKLNAVALQLPIGVEGAHEGLIDLVTREKITFEGENGQKIVRVPVPADMVDEMEEYRSILVEKLADVDDDVAEAFLMEEDPALEVLRKAIREATIAQTICPVFMGTALKNSGVQTLLDGVVDYLPSPKCVTNKALDQSDGEKEVELESDSEKPLIALAFKLEESKFGQLTYMRVYQGKLAKGMTIYNAVDKKKMRLPRLARMHSNDMEDIDSCGAGDIVAVFGMDCRSGDTFTDGKLPYTMTSMHVPNPVISLSVKPTAKGTDTGFSKALQRFQKEDPTFRVHVDKDTGETIMSGMGELHLDVYVERMKREYKVDAQVGKPQVNFLETIQSKAEFSYLHKKQSGGSGQFGKVEGWLEPMDPNEEKNLEFDNQTVGGSIPPQFISACEKGFNDAIEKGPLLQQPVTGVRMVVNDGASHAVDSSELAFRIATVQAFKQGFLQASPQILEPIMNVEISAPEEFQGSVIGQINRRKGLIVNSETQDGYVIVECEAPLNEMFGYSTDLRSITQGKGEFTMEYKSHAPVSAEVQKKLVAEAEAKKAADSK